MGHINWTKEYNVKHNIANIKMLKIFLSEHIDNNYFSTVVYLGVIKNPDFSKGIEGEFIMQMRQMYIADNEIQSINLCEDWIKSNLGTDFEILQN
jgi:hypothetical protein